MMRGKIEMKRIENAASGQVSFSKRRNSLLKKAHKLPVLCDAEVAVIIFSQRGRLSEFSSHAMHKTLDRYYRHLKEVKIDGSDGESHLQKRKLEAANMVTTIELLEVSMRKLLGQCDLCSYSIKELQDIAGLLQRSLTNIRTRKLFPEQMPQLKAQERLLLEENARLLAKLWNCPLSGEKSWVQATREQETGRLRNFSSGRDNVYYKQLMARRGLLESDQAPFGD